MMVVPKPVVTLGMSPTSAIDHQEMNAGSLQARIRDLQSQLEQHQLEEVGRSSLTSLLTNLAVST